MLKKVDLFGINYSAMDYDGAVDRILAYIDFLKFDREKHVGFGVSALAVHGLIEGYTNEEVKKHINNIELVLPDGQPIRWAINWFYKRKLKDRVYGPTLMLHLLNEASFRKIPVYFYGSKQSTLDLLKAALLQKYPDLQIVGMQPDRFRESTDEEKEYDRKLITESGAKLVFVGRGCPRQEKWVSENKEHIPAVLVAVGAAFDFHAGTVKQAPSWMQNAGLEWLFRLMQEPKRLWKRYLTTNSIFIYLFFKNTIKKLF